MKRDYSRMVTFGIIGSFLFLLLTFSSRSGETEKAALMADLYKKLYFTRVASDAAMNTAVLNRIAQNDYNTATNVLILRVQADLQVMNMETNYAWSEQDKKAKAVAEEYLKAHGNK
jgi:hypothetical protein